MSRNPDSPELTEGSGRKDAKSQARLRKVTNKKVQYRKRDRGFG